MQVKIFKVVSWPCSCLTWHALVFDRKVRVWYKRGVRVGRMISKLNLSLTNTKVGRVSAARQPSPVLPFSVQMVIEQETFGQSYESSARGQGYGGVAFLQYSTKMLKIVLNMAQE